MEVYDIVFFDWVLLCHSNFFPHFYPELKGIVGPQQFGYNKASHLRHFALYLPASALAGHAFSRLEGDPESIMRGLQGSLRSGG